MLIELSPNLSPYSFHVTFVDIVSTENHSNTIEETKPVPIRASKRRASQESSGSNGSSKEAKSK